MTENLIELDLKVFDDEGNVVDMTPFGFRAVELADIVTYAADIITARRDGAELHDLLDRLDEALAASGVIETGELVASNKPSC